MKSYQELFAELKRRKVFRVAVIYGIVSFGILQAADLMLPRLGLPDWTVTFMVALVVLAFPVALLLAWAFEVTPEGVKRTDAADPGELERIASAPATNRWSAGILALVGVALLATSTWWIAGRSSGADTTAQSELTDARLVDLSDDPRPSLAVLPFVNMSADENQEYFSDGMTEEILNTLARVKELRVAGRTSAFAYKGTNKDLREIGNELGVAYLIEGSVRKAGDQLRITTQLIDAADGSHMWSDQYDRPMVDVFAIQTEIAEAIAEELTVSLGLENASDLVTPTSDLEAYDLYLAGRSRLRARQEGVFEATVLFKAAIARDSAWAPAWAGLANALELQVWYPEDTEEDVPFDETLAEAEQAARRALELSPQNSTALIVLGSIHRNRYEWEEAETFFERALALDPDNAEAHQQYGEWLHKRGRVAEAVRLMDRASILDPAPVRIWQVVLTLRTDGRWDEVEEMLGWAESEGLIERFGALRNAADTWPERQALSEGRFEDIWPLDSVSSPADTAGRGEILRALRAKRFDLLPDSIREQDIWPEAYLAVGEPDRAAERLVEDLRAARLNPDLAWQPPFDPIRTHPLVQEHLTSIGLGGVAVQRTPVERRTRPAVLRQADANARATAAETAP